MNVLGQGHRIKKIPGGGGGGWGGHTQSVTKHTFSDINFVSLELNLYSVELNLAVLGVSMCSVAIPRVILLNLESKIKNYMH